MHSSRLAPFPSDGSGMLMASAQFPSAGWWVRANFSKDDFADDVQFAIDVNPE